ncbi:HAL/PAL/TAL family ammonia-lyase [Escherichia albertii]|uniref:HAL/PAL/TAL family ammonia-lyase n=1 Tax=Escherichia albertii TaxID=208962 RepID=UPI0011F1AC57|nr:aromatic amino acid ammonia-lyase [Escherichia albertii]MCB2260322.1 aromatic amino acid lyase [Escherichia albertii]MCB2267926.1 aromatic amino acid lyase [Escherichia albertii]MCB2272742.1 aromatic amino acid lyase [Escherichia albertii]
MKKTVIATLCLSLFCPAVAWSADNIILDGHSLTLDDAWAIAQGQKQVDISPATMERVEKANKLLMIAAGKGVPVYGLTVGVGLNKDKSLFDAHGKLTPEVIQASREFNINALHAHAAGVGPDMPDELVRMAMVIRLNTMLTGNTGAQPQVAKIYQQLLNKNITPVVPSRGSVGEADITLASHIGDVMLGEWRVRINGKVVPSDKALKQAGIEKLQPLGKDALSILSTNAISTAYSAKALLETRQIINVTPAVFGLSLEALNGNVAPFLTQSLSVRPFPGIQETAETLRNALKDSYLWQHQEGRALQDPLSFRTTVFVLNEARREWNEAYQMLEIQMNSSDDNPAVIVNADRSQAENSQVEQYFVSSTDANGETISGAIFPTSNFEPLPLALTIQDLSVAMGHLAHNSVQRTLHLSDDHFTGLSRFLASDTNQKGHAFGAIQKPQVALLADIRELVNPVSLDGQPMAGTIEDTYSNNLRVSKRLSQIAEDMRTIYGLELLHSSQAIDLRKQKMSDLKLGKMTGKLYDAYRAKVPFVEQDRIFSDNIADSSSLVASFPVESLVNMKSEGQ